MQTPEGAWIAGAQCVEAESLLLSAWNAADRQTSLDLHTLCGKADQTHDWQQKLK